MKKFIVGPLLCVALAGVAVAMVACEDDEDPEEARVALCEDNAALDQAVADFEALGDANTFDEFETAADNVASALDDLASSAEDYLDANDDLVEAYGNSLEALDDALDNVSSDMTVGDARASVQDEFDAAKADRDALIASANCG